MPRAKKPVQPANVMEMLAGDAGAAILTGSKNVIAELVAAQSVRSDFVDHYRTAESGTDYVLEERWVREEGLAKIVSPLIATLLEENNLSVEDIDHFILPVAYPSHARAIARTCGIQEDAVADALFTDCGFSGVAHPLLMLNDCLDRATPDSLILLTGFGQGMDAILLRTTEKITSYQASITVQNFMTNLRIEDNYPRFLASNGQFHPDWGMRAERDNRTAQTVAFDKSRDIYGLVGGICTSCGTPQFPKARRCVNPECNALDTQQDYRFADIPATVKSFTEDWMAFNRNPPLIYGNISFEGGGNMFIEMTGFAPGILPLETKLRWISVLRILMTSAASIDISGKLPLRKNVRRRTDMAEGIKDKVAIIGMGCSKFGERWDARPEDLITEAFEEALKDAKIEKEGIDAAWFGVFYDEQNVGKSAYPLSQYLRLPNIPVTRVENLCALERSPCAVQSMP